MEDYLCKIVQWAIGQARLVRPFRFKFRNHSRPDVLCYLGNLEVYKSASDIHGSSKWKLQSPRWLI